MVKRRANKTFRIIVAVILIILLISLILFLARWTRLIGEEKQRRELSAALRQIVENRGVEAVLALSGVELANIYHGEDGLTILTGTESTWRYSSSEMQNITLYERVSPSVVHITTGSEGALAMSTDTKGTGSGIILSSDGYILTNAHVVEKATTLQVGLWDGSVHSAFLVGLDTVDDLAVIKIAVDRGMELQPVKLGDSESLKVGQKVIAIGNPFGYDRTMTEGIVSGLNRPIKSAEGKVIMNAIQTDATINPGNSGGPLLNSQGEVVGINTSIFSTTGSSQGLGFAIPVATALTVIPDLISSGKVSRGWLDVAAVQLSPQLISYAKIAVDKGVLVSQVASGGNAERAGIQGGTQAVQYGSSRLFLGGDIVTRIGDVTIEDLNDFYLALLPMRSGQKVEVAVLRGSERKVFTVELIERTAQHLGSLVR
ncbi:MAG TPA: trypsin-like peptidase domain-containing protein [Sphaerochaeta sp.]|nr:trypsin-like peptidase domain-containing protein [Sphaerochaeta sp.]